ncbi:alpha/beta hydrolase [Phenylobacterium sp.]|uniref:alpha/beta fold hydrolase n=1 Tax=Phenylobacterium sp. TaxID=1871053 RepID=UPI002F9496E3
MSLQIHRRAVLAAAGLALPAAAIAQPQAQAGPFRFKGWKGQETDAERGFFEAPEDRRDPRSRRIRLHYVRFASTNPRPGPPIVYLAGGPGGTATGTFTGPRFPILLALREVCDVIAFDQRGTGLSNHIPRRPRPSGPVPLFTRAGLTAHMRTELQRAWADWTAKGVAMRGYNTNESADDIEDLRQHLAADKISLWGISYGSHLGLAVLKRHGRHVDRVALASLEGQDQTVKRPARWDGYIEQVAALAGAPGLPDLMRRVHTRMEADPVPMSLRFGGPAPVDVRVGGFPVQMAAGSLAANPDTLAMLPRLYSMLDAGKTEMFSAFAGQMGGVLGIEGMPEAMDLASGISPRKLAMVEREARTSVIGDALNFPMPHLLGAIPGADLGEDFRRPIHIAHPALLVAGSLDGRTVLAEQAEVAAQFRNKSQVLVENAGHNVFEAHPEVQAMLVRFFRGERVPDTGLALPPPKFQV